MRLRWSALFVLPVLLLPTLGQWNFLDFPPVHYFTLPFDRCDRGEGGPTTGLLYY